MQRLSFRHRHQCWNNNNNNHHQTMNMNNMDSSQSSSMDDAITTSKYFSVGREFYDDQYDEPIKPGSSKSNITPPSIDGSNEHDDNCQAEKEDHHRGYDDDDDNEDGSGADEASIPDKLDFQRFSLERQNSIQILEKCWEQTLSSTSITTATTTHNNKRQSS